MGFAKTWPLGKIISMVTPDFVFFFSKGKMIACEIINKNNKMSECFIYILL